MGICSFGHVAVWRCFDYEKFGIPARVEACFSFIIATFAGSAIFTYAGRRRPPHGTGLLKMVDDEYN